MTCHNSIRVCASCLWLCLVSSRLHLPLLTLFLTILTNAPLALSFPNTQTSLWLNSTVTFYKMSQIQPPCQLLTYTHWSVLVHYTLNIHTQETTVQSHSAPLTSPLGLNDCPVNAAPVLVPLHTSLVATRLLAMRHYMHMEQTSKTWHKQSN